MAEELVYKQIKLKNREIKLPPKDDSKICEPDFLGREFFDLKNYACLLISKKRSGKSTVIYNILEKSVCKKDKIIIICPTIHLDDAYIGITKMLCDKGIDYIESSSIFGKDDKGVKFDVLNSILNKYRETKPTFKTWIILDDLPKAQLQGVSVENMMKTCRHYNINLLISSQNFFDISPATRSNCDFLIIFKKIPIGKLKSIHSDLQINIPFDNFIALYHDITQDDYSFMYIQRYPFEMYRKNFDTLIELNE